MDRYSGRDADLDAAPQQKMTNVERHGIGNVFVRAAPPGAAPQAGSAAPVSKIEVVPSRREVKRAAATVAMPPPPPAARPAPPGPAQSASGYQPPPWASQPPAGAGGTNIALLARSG